MSALDDIAAAIDAIREKLEEAGNATQAVDQEVDDASSTAASLGVDATVQGLAQLSGELQSLAQQLGSAGEARSRRWRPRGRWPRALEEVAAGPPPRLRAVV